MTGQPPFRRLLIANRGEIAIRIARTCRELGIASVAVATDVDREAPHLRHADHVEWIGASDAYLSGTAIIGAAARSGAEAIHPGYGFLSESADFADAVATAGLAFVGPPPATLRKLGNKLEARRSAVAAQVPVVPGLLVPFGEAPAADVARIGFPLLVKAAAGGGGRGMRRVESAAELGDAIAAAGREAVSAFGDGTLYVERLVTPARHIEVQVLGDRFGSVVAVGERDCSIQRRHQKLVEEAPAPGIAEDLRRRLVRDAARVAGAADFYSAATVEFLVGADGSHAFLEMNTRLQVEHGVSELVTGIDLVAWQIRIAAGERLPADMARIATRGHAIEVRLYAEDPWHDFRPAAGRIGAWQMPSGPGVRVDAGVEAGYQLPTEYDPLLAKLLVHAEDRPAAVARLRRALDETAVGGVDTTLGFHRWLVDQPAFVAGEHDLGFVAQEWGSGPPLDPGLGQLAATAIDAAMGMDVMPPRPPRHAAPSAWQLAARSEGLER